MTEEKAFSRGRTRHETMEPDTFDQSQPRLGRRESEPHSFEITYIYNVLRNNFPQHHVLWDLHHYFKLPNEETIDIQFDISFFLDFTLPYTLSSYRSSSYGNKIPDLVINILSKSTWKTDLSENLDICKLLGIPVYIVFCPFDVATQIYSPPFLRVYLKGSDQNYQVKEVRDLCVQPSGEIILENVISLGKRIPFHVGLKKLDQKHEGSLSRFRLVFLDSVEPNLLITKNERLELKNKESENKIAKYQALLRKHGIEPDG
ncbi:MAG: hypothetical protein ACTSW1_04750 [Candidatus Hodarchaeales archaeon]